MANSLYGKAREKFAQAALNWDTSTIKVVLVDTGAYTVSIDVHEFLSDIPSGARIATSPALTGKTSVLGECDADDVTVVAVSGTTIEAAVIYADTGTPATSALIAFIDTATGLVLTPNGGDVLIGWNNGVNKIFRL